MINIDYIDRQTKKIEKEKVYGQRFVKFFYGSNPISRFFSFFLLPLITRLPFSSLLFSSYYKSPISKKKIKPFIEKFHVDISDSLESVESFKTFNDFFVRKLKPEARPIVSGNDVAILPADGRYLVYPNIQKADGFYVKGEKFSLDSLLKNHHLAHKYENGAMAFIRLCPTDYHRFHFPCNCIPEKAELINGYLYSVNPLALKKNIHIFAQNKRFITPLHTKNFGTVLYIEVGATLVGSVHQTYTPGENYAKGDEKGYFEFGASSIILLFEPFRIEFDQDLIDASNRKIETLGHLGQSLGRALSL